MKFFFPIFLFVPLILFGQNDIQEIVNSEYEKGYFNGTVFYADGKQSVKINKGFSNIQFDVAIDNNTHFPIASVTKLFTSLAILQLQEKGLIDLKDKIGKYIPNLPENCNDITIRDLMIHHSGLENEPIKAVMNKYSIDEYIRSFVKKSSNDTLKFNYNNVDFVLLSKIIDNITKKTFSQSIEDMIIQPLKLENTGFVNENDIIKNLAYGYHNYSFGEGEKDEPLFNDRRYRDHRDITQYDLYIDVIKDDNFKGNVYTEVGSWNNYQRINKFLLNSKLSEKEKEEELLAIYRDLDYTILWEKYNYYYLLNSIFEINRKREEKDKILLFPLDLEFDWKNYDCHSQYKLFNEYSENSIIDRNIIMGKNFVKFYEYAKSRNPIRPKALVIQNTYHGYIRIPKYLPLPTQPDIYSTGEYIYKTYPENTTNIYINFFVQTFDGTLTNKGLFDASFYYTESDNIGFDLKNTPFGSSEFDLYNFGGDYDKVNFDYIFDGMIFYKPIAEMKLITGIPNVYPKEFEKQFYERLALIDGITYEESVRQNKELLKEINQKNEIKLQDSVILRINTQINYWLK